MIDMSDYRAIEQIHDGLRSRVYRGVRASDQRPVIIKVHRDEFPSFVELGQYRNHYTITSNLDIPGVERPLALERHGNGFAIVSADTGAVSLRQHARRAAPGPDEVLAIAAQLARIFEALHARRVVHKDVKPDNILVLPDGDLRLIDFSIATLLPRESGELQRATALEGTLAYISPEQTGRMNRWIDYRSDYYSLGVTLYELLTSQLPFQTTDPMELIHCHIARSPTPPVELNPAVPQALSDIVMKLMAKSAESRYQSATGLRADLEVCREQLRRTGSAPAFPLGRGDVSDRFLVPDRLYGRDAELGLLLRAFDRVAAGAAELLLVAGHSGIGKSALINEVHKPIVRQRGYFAAGKFDQFQRDVPFSSLVQAFRGLIRQVLGEPGERVVAWQRRLGEALGGEGQVIADVIPEVELLIGRQAPVPELPPADNHDRFNRLFQAFIRRFAAPEHPLVVFLDDLQWADTASLTLLQLLMSERSTGHLLVIGAFRDNEVGPDHPLSRMLDRTRKGGATVTQVALQPLDMRHLNLLVADTLRRPPEQSLDLSELVMRRTQGNPFFTNQLLRSLHQDGLIALDAASGRFVYDLAPMGATAAPADVVAFMVEQIGRLPPGTRTVLELAAAIGNQFELTTLAVVHERSQADTAADLWPALAAGVVLPVDDAYRAFQHPDAAGATATEAPRGAVHYRFLHDRVQQAAYSMIADADKPATHLAIGRLLLRSASTQERDERLFDIVNQLDTGAALIDERDERDELARLNLAAGLKAKASTAYAAAARYLAVGAELLGADGWTDQYDLTLALHRARAEVEYLEGNFDASEQLIRSAIGRARTALEKAEVYLMLIVQYTLRARYPEAIGAGREALALVGVDLPADDLEAARDAEMAAVKREIGERTIASLADLPDMADPEHKVAMKLLTTMGPPTYRAHQALWAVICAKAVRLCLRHGNAPQTAYSHTSYGGLLGYVHNDYRAGAEFGALALRLAGHFNNPSDQSVVHLMLGSSLTHWSRHLRHATEDYHQAYSVGLDSGNLQYAAYAFGHDMYCRFYQGVALDQVLTEIAGYLVFSRRRKNQWAIDLLEGGRLVVANLSGATAGPDVFATAELAEEQFVADCHDHRNAQVLCIYAIMKALALYLHGLLPQAHACVREAAATIASVATQGLLPAAEHAFVEALVLAALHDGAPDDERARIHARLAVIRRQISIWAESCADNMLHKRLIVEAEIARISGRLGDAADLHDQAIDAAHAGQFVQHVALANELAARCWLARGRPRLAQHYMTEAYYGYARWGAVAKQRQLERAYPELVATATTGTRPRVTVEGTLSASPQWDTLDLGTVLKASQALFSEILLDKLLARLLLLTLENAGAERGFIVLLRAGVPTIEAAASAGSQDVTVLEGVPVDGTDRLCAAVVHYVARTGEAVVLDDISDEPAYASDPYVSAQRPRSLLCMPVVNHGRQVAIAYLENNLSAGCFTASRFQVVEVLLTHAAVAVENAMLYADLQRAHTEARAGGERLEVEVAERTEELRLANGRLQREFTDRIRAEAERARLQEEVIAAQQTRLAELSTPIIPITEDIVIMPLVGMMDAQRADQVLQTALQSARSMRARVVILDITGMHHLDGDVADRLVKTAAALRLVGAAAVLTGVRPALAQSLVGLGINLAGLVTCGTLQNGFAYALASLRPGSPAVSTRPR